MSVGDALRREIIEAERGLDPEERVLLALRLGDSDVELVASATGGTRDEVLARLTAQRRAGRRPSRSAEGR